MTTLRAMGIVEPEECRTPGCCTCPGMRAESPSECSDQAKWYTKARVYGAIAAAYQRALAWRHSEKGGVPRAAVDEIGALLGKATPAELAKLRAENDRLRAALTEMVRTHAGSHSEDCHACGAHDDDVSDDPDTPDPHCDCGALATRQAARAALRCGT